MQKYLQHFLPPGIDINELTFGALLLIAFLAVAIVWGTLTVRAPNQRRIREVANRRETLRDISMAPRRRGRNTEGSNFMRSVVLSLNLLRTEQAQQVAIKLAAAGWRRGDAVVRYFFFKLVLPAVIGLGGLLWMTSLHILSHSTSIRAAAAAGLALLGFFLPDMYVNNAATKRQTKLQRQLPDMLDMMVTCSEAGLSLDATLRRASEEFAKAAPELSDEIALTCVEMEFLPDRGQALLNFAERTGLPSIKSMVNTLQQAQRFGTPLSQALRTLAAEFRDERILKAEEKAARLPALLTVPMVLFILPPLFIVLLGPAIMRIYDSLIH
jgi:tight adherence protein C